MSLARFRSACRLLLLGSLVFSAASCGGSSTSAVPSTPAVFVPNFLATEVRVDQDVPAPADAPSRDLQICLQGSTLHAVWSDQRTGAYRIYYNRSADGGLTWLAADVQLDVGIAGASDQFPSICCEGNNVYIAFERDYDANGFEDSYFTRSTDGGTTWLPAAVLLNNGTTPGTVNTGAPSLCCSGMYLYALWEDEQSMTDNDIYVNASGDGGATWFLTPVRVDHGPAMTNADRPRVCCDGQRVNVVWYDDRNGAPDIYTNYSTDGGATWQATDTRLDLGDLAGSGVSLDPTVCCDGTRVYVAWEDGRDGAPDIYFNRSEDGGVTWLAADVRLDVGDMPGVGPSTDVVLCCEGERVHAAWEDERAGGAEDIYFNRSLDGGVTWLAADLRLDTGDAAGAAESSSPVLCCLGDRVYVAFREQRASSPGPYFNASLDGGATWMAAPVNVSSVSRPIGGDEVIVCDANQIVVGWARAFAGYSDIYVNRTAP